MQPINVQTIIENGVRKTKMTFSSRNSTAINNSNQPIAYSNPGFGSKALPQEPTNPSDNIFSTIKARTDCLDNLMISLEEIDQFYTPKLGGTSREEKKLVDLLKQALKSNQTFLETEKSNLGIARAKMNSEFEDRKKENEFSVKQHFLSELAQLEKYRETKGNRPQIEGNIFYCAICYDNNHEDRDRKFKVSRCGHILCEHCWESSLFRKKECPRCKTPISDKDQLFSVY